MKKVGVKTSSNLLQIPGTCKQTQDRLRVLETQMGAPLAHQLLVSLSCYLGHPQISANLMTHYFFDIKDDYSLLESVLYHLQNRRTLI